FYLSDVGLFGVYYRYGFLTPLLVLLYFGGYIWILRQCKDKGNLLSAMQFAFVAGMLNFPLSNALTFSGDMYGMAAAFFLYFSKVQASEKTLNANIDRVNYGQFQYRNYKLE